MAISVEAPVVTFTFGLGDEPRPAAAGVEVFDKNFGIKPFSVLGPDGMGLELGDDLLGQQFHNDKILETARNARTAKETKPPCANEDKSCSLGIFAQGGYLAGPGGGDEVYPRKLFRIFVDNSNTQAGMNRIVLIGNGFDLAHDLPTSYRDFMRVYQIILQKRLLEGETNPADGLCSIKIDGSDLKKLEHLLDTIEEVTLFGWGEPTMHPHFIDILKYLNDFPVRKYFVTNGMRLDKIKNALFDYKVDIMAISLDGAKPETNDRIRFGGNFNFIVQNIRDIVKEKKERGLDYPYMNFVMALMGSNIEELPQLIELASDIGLEEVKGVYLTVFTNNLLNETLYNKQDKVVKIFNEAEELAKKLNIKLKLPYIQGEDIAGDKYHKDCFVAWRDFFLASDGYVRPCQSTAVKFLNFENYNNFEDMWNGKEFQEFRKNVNDQNNMCNECKRCFQSSHANWNNELSFIQINQQFAPEWEK